jgi:uncharacterized membrane protein
MKKVFKIIGLIVVLMIVLLFVFSKYKKHADLPYKAIAVSIEIQQPPDSVFSYLGNSGNAKNWSSYVHHISILNGDSHKDGTVGSTRRCFKNEDESGIIWDEDITEVVSNKKRQLSIYNAKGFPMMTEGLYTEQIYTPIGDSATKLTFTLFYKEAPGFWSRVKTHLASFRVYSIYRKNLEKIKQIVESGNSSE